MTQCDLTILLKIIRQGGALLRESMHYVHLPRSLAFTHSNAMLMESVLEFIFNLISGKGRRPRTIPR